MCFVNTSPDALTDYTPQASNHHTTTIKPGPLCDASQGLQSSNYLEYRHKTEPAQKMIPD